MNVYKLCYPNQALAIENLLANGILLNSLEKEYGKGVHAVVEIGTICLNEPTEEIAPIYADGYHYDVMCEQDVDFGVFEVIVKNPKHNFSGCNYIINELI